mmetsp:Transcript_21771/g.62428  ORF Transcript_21771/g.62428 Transcript_21771/m.62428 type:complete len:1128 (-) Transcript_21771:120-3503(-)
MAARQGLSGTISQATDDAKRAVISRAPTSIVSHSWLSNLNTTMTVKSAPPRSPEVVTMLSSKSGWLVKRNEQHVWQRRWCCVVPHTFLYYFEAAPNFGDGDHHDSGGGGGVSGFFPSTTPATPDAAAPAVVENQEVLNAAVRDGLGGFGGGGNGNGEAGDADERYYAAAATEGEMAEVAALADPRGPTATSGSNLQPVGIIDLECYSNVNRTNRSEGVMELTGDPITNPDLRSFYFQAANADDAEEWTKAFLSERHCGLKDELDAIREVCNTFPLQLRDCADMIDRAEEKAASSEKELYRVRSAAEEGRRRALEMVRDILERRWLDDSANGGSGGGSGGGGIRRTWSSDENGHQGQLSSVQHNLLNGLENDRSSYLEQLEEALRSPESVGTMNGGVLPAMRLLSDYVSSVVTSYASLGAEVHKAEKQLSSVATVDKASLDDMQAKYDQLERESREQRSAYGQRVAELEGELKTLHESHTEVDNHLQQSRMEFAMYQSQSKAKLGETSQHKKILKKEVIELRKRMEDVGSDCDAAQHEADRLRTDLETERQRNATLERYIERIEKQLSNQQNMCEIMIETMSQTGSVKDSSILGKVIGPAADDAVGSGLPPSADASPSVNKSRKNRLPRSFKTPTKQTPRSIANQGSGGGGGSLIKLHDEDEMPPRKKESTRRSASSVEADTEQGTEPLTATTFTLASSAVNSPLSTGGAESPRKPAISLDEPDEGGGDDIGDHGEGDEMGRNAVEADERAKYNETNESNLANKDKHAGGRSGKSRKSKSRSQRYQKIMATKREETAAKREVDPPAASRAAPFTDADLHDEIQNYERSDQYIYDENEDDAKSHMSDITEDRTYKLPYNEQARPRVIRQEKPRYVDKKPPKAYVDRVVEDEYAEQQSATGSSKKLSVAERARMEAQRSSNSVTVRASPANSPMRPTRGRSELPRRLTDNESRSSTVRSRSNSPSVQSKRSFFARVGTRVVTAIDNSVLGVPNQAPGSSGQHGYHENGEEYADDDRSASSGSGESSGSYDEEESVESSSEESSVEDEQSRQIKKEIETPLAERQRIQREKQLEFLKQQGLLKSGTEGSLRGGPGAVSVEKKRSSKSPQSSSLSSRRSGSFNDTSYEAGGH